MMIPLRIAIFLSLVIYPLGMLSAPQQASGTAKSAERDEPSLEIFGFRLGVTTVQEIQSKLGMAKIENCGTGTEHCTQICYAAWHNPNKILIFESGFSGGWKKIDGFSLMSNFAETPKPRQCKKTKVLDEYFGPSSTLRLGASRNELLAKLGIPKKESRGSIAYEWNYRMPMTPSEVQDQKTSFGKLPSDPQWDVTDTLELHFVHGSIALISLHHDVSY